MKEAIFILLVLLALLALTAYRYRRQIRSVMEFWRSIQALRSGSRPEQSRINEEPAAKGPLVNCQKCGTWVSEDKAVRLGRSAFYCSTGCLEKAGSKTAF